MRRWLVVWLAASCGHPASAPDARSGLPSLTVDRHAAFGLVISEPPGIRCGSCEAGAPCPPGPATDTTCGFDFAPGTPVSLSLVGQTAYTDAVCASQSDDSIASCSFVIAAPVTVGVWGEVAARDRDSHAR